MRSFEELCKNLQPFTATTAPGKCWGVLHGDGEMLAEVDIDEPKGCKKLVVYVEMDRCATDAVQAVTGCSLGKRTLKFLSSGKMAGQFSSTRKPSKRSEFWRKMTRERW